MKRLPWIHMIGTCVVAGMLVGCNSAPKRDLNYAPVRPVTPPPAAENTGSIYQAGNDMTWFEDTRARRVGDMLTVKLQENTNANKTATTDISKDNSTAVTNPTIFGVNPVVPFPNGLKPYVSATTGNLSASLESANKFGGAGTSTQSNALTGDITVTITEVLPNGNLAIRGEKRLHLNQGNEYVKLAGIVRPADIERDNSIVSTRIADPTIIYEGDGAPADANEIGWLSHFFIKAIFPF